MTVPANLNVLKNHRYADIFPMMVVDLLVAADLKDRIKNQEYPDRVVKAFITKVESEWGICV